MTVPMMPGWWDQNGEALQSLAQTMTRIANPHFDNQLALSQSIRQNPENLQKAVDASYLNPDMFAQTYGPRMLQQLASQGRASSTAQIEDTSRNILANPVAQDSGTVGEDAARSKMGVGTARQVKREDLGNTFLSEGIDNTRYNALRDRDINALKDPIDRARLQEILAAESTIPELRDIDLLGLATRSLEGKWTEADNKSYLGLVNYRPELEKVFENIMALLRQERGIEAQGNRQDRSLAAAEGRASDAQDNTITRAAIELTRKYPSVTMTDARAYFSEGPESTKISAPARAILQREEASKQTFAKTQAFAKAVSDFDRIASKADPESREAEMAGVMGSLSAVLGFNISLESHKPEGNWFSTENRFRITDQDGTSLPVTAQDISELITNPEVAGQLFMRATYSKMTPQQLQAVMTELQGLQGEEAKTYYVIAQQEFAKMAAPSGRRR